jgi:zinc protease
MFKGSAHMPPGQFSIRVTGMGGNDNAFTGQDYTAYHENVTVDHLPEIMAMEADRMQNLTFPPDHVKSERQVVLEERRQRTEDDPRGYFSEQMKAILFINHPYGHPVGGWFNEVDALTRDNVMAYYKKWYVPNNAILVVSGDITAAQLRPLAEKTFGMVPSHPVPPRDWTSVPPQLGLPRLVMHSADIEQPVWQRLIRVPSLHQNRRDALALEVLSDIMDGGAATRFYKALVVEQKLATSVDFSYDPTAYDDALLWIDAVPADGVSMDKLEAAIDAQLRLLVKKGITETELAEAKTRLKDSSVFDRDSIQGPAMLFGQVLATGGSIDDVEYWPSQIDGVTMGMIEDVAKRYLDPDNFNRRPYLTGIMLPDKSGTKSAGSHFSHAGTEIMQ